MPIKPAQPPKIHDKETLKLLIDNIDNLEHPQVGWIKHPYFQHRFSANREGVQQVTRTFCEALMLLLEKNDRLKKRPGRPRKTEAADA